MTIRAYVDNDAIYKLAKCNLLHPCRRACGIRAQYVTVLDSLRYQVGVNSPKKRNSFIRKHGDVAFEQISEFIRAVKFTEGVPDGFDRFLGIDNFEPGEASLFLSCAQDSKSVLLTGDKRALRILCELQELKEIREAVAGRVYCVEQQFLKMIERFGFESIKNNIVPALNLGIHIDTTLDICFASREDVREERAIESLRNYAASIARESPGLLARESSLLS